MTDTITAEPTREPIHYTRHRDNPRRPLDWIWQRAKWLLTKNKSPDPQWDSPLVCAAHALLAARQHGEKPDAAASDIIHAEQIHLDDNLLKAELQARLLAHRNIEDAATVVDLPMTVVFAYEQLFFNVLDRIDKHRFILDQVIKKPPVLNPRDVATMWQFWGYSSGPVILDDIISDFRLLGVPDYSYVIDGSIPRSSRSPLGRAIDRSILVMCLPNNKAGFQALQHMAFTAVQLQEAQLPEMDHLQDSNEFWDLTGDMLDEAFVKLAQQAVQEYWAEAS